MRTFTDDETGEKFELHATMPLVNAEFLTIKPIKAVEKKAIYWIEFRKVFKRLDDKAISFSATERQAQKVAAAVEALMAFIQEKDDDALRYMDMEGAIEAARVALQENV